jgi:hypothetical protein
MALDVPTPDPPSLTGPQSRGHYEAIGDSEDDVGDDYRRAEIESVLADGAWEDGFQEWTTGTDLVESEYDLLVRHGCFETMDFYWHPADDEVGYHIPDLSDDAREALSADVDEVESELDSLGRVVSEMLENDYLRRDENDFGFFSDEE